MFTVHEHEHVYTWYRIHVHVHVHVGVELQAEALPLHSPGSSGLHPHHLLPQGGLHVHVVALPCLFV